MAKNTEQDNFGGLVVKRYSNRRLYNTETKKHVSYIELLKIVRNGVDIKVIDSQSGEDVTKVVLIQMILEEEKSDKTVLPTEFLFQVIRSSESSLQDFFKNHLPVSYAAYLRTREEFDARFRTMMELAFSAPQTLEKLIPGAETMRGIISGKKRDTTNEE
ncbi:MAG: polyhydroxyalkanoate synthesis regulator DNA-binding domain-containing protein [Pyrinomonadaceae bacterium]